MPFTAIGDDQLRRDQQADDDVAPPRQWSPARPTCTTLSRMSAAHPVVSPRHVAASLTEVWSPRVIAELDDSYVKTAKVHGEFSWHAHDSEDEMFLILAGELRIELEDRHVLLREGELFVVPRGVRHRPVAERECLLMLIEKKATLHTGSEITERTRAIEEQLRPL
jgi:mannose-6-phosphate isomerase-like protein (cupin superfamily)